MPASIKLENTIEQLFEFREHYCTRTYQHKSYFKTKSKCNLEQSCDTVHSCVGKDSQR